MLVLLWTAGASVCHRVCRSNATGIVGHFKLLRSFVGDGLNQHKMCDISYDNTQDHPCQPLGQDT